MGWAQWLGQGRLGEPFKADPVRLTLVPGSGAAPDAGTEVAVTVRPVDEVVGAAGQALIVSIPKATISTDAAKIVSLEFTGATPRMASTFVAKVLQLYFDRHQAWKSEEALAAESFVTTQVQGVKRSLDDAEQQLADFKKTAGVVGLGDDTKGLIDQLGKYEQQRVAAQLQVDAFNQIGSAIKKGNGGVEQYLVGEAEDPVLVSLSTQLADAQARLTSLRERFTDEAPAIKEQQAQVDAQLATVDRYVQNRHSRSQQQLDALGTMIARFDERLRAVPHAELELGQLTRNTEVLSKMYSFLLERQEQAMVAKAANISRNHVLDNPAIPTREDSPVLPLRLALGLVFGLFVGLAAAVIRWATRATFQTDADVRRDLGPLAVFASVPRQPSRRDTARGAARKQRPGQSPGYPSAPFAEAFRHLRTNIYYSDESHGPQVLLFTSPCPGDGKTVCTLQLACSLAADGKRVLVIEADLRRPSLHLFLGEQSEPGLGDLPARDDITRPIQGWFGSFDCVMAGAPTESPAELLSGARFGELVRQARNAYDFVLIDSPPFPLVSDTLIVAMHADRVFSVVRPHNTRRAAAREHLQRLSAASRRHAVVINDTSAGDAYDNYGNPRPAARGRLRRGGLLAMAEGGAPSSGREQRRTDAAVGAARGAPDGADRLAGARAVRICDVPGEGVDTAAGRARLESVLSGAHRHDGNAAGGRATDVRHRPSGLVRRDGGEHRRHSAVRGAGVFRRFAGAVRCGGPGPGVADNIVQRWRFRAWFGSAATVIAAAGLAQFVLQFVVPLKFVYPVENLVPPAWRTQLFNNVATINWRVSVYRVNGVFMLEASEFSQLCAIALVSELIAVQTKTWRAVLFIAAILASYSGTGLMILAAALPVVVIRSGRWDLVARGLLLLIPLGLLAGPLHLDSTLARVNEFSGPGSSGYARFISWTEMFGPARWPDAATVFFGHGAGQTKGAGEMVYSKIPYEYGALAGAAYLSFAVWVLFSSACPLPLRVAVFLCAFLMNGAYSSWGVANVLTLLVWPAEERRLLHCRPGAPRRCRCAHR